MKRPFALIGLTAMAVLTVCFYFLGPWLNVVFISAGVLFLVSLIVPVIRKQISFTAFFATVMASMLLFSGFTNFYVHPVQEKYAKENTSFKGTFCEEVKEKNNIFYYEVKTESIGDEKAKVKIMLTSYKPLVCEVGDKVSFEGEIKSAEHDSYIADRIYLVAYDTEGVASVERCEQKSFYFYVVSLRESIRNALYSELDTSNAAFASAVLIGDKSSLSEEITENLRRTGLSHIAVVSGFHLSVIVMFYRKTFARFIKNKYINAVSTLLIILMFLFLTGFGKSAIRAAIMLCFLMGAELFGRFNDTINSLGVAAFFMCLFNPYIIADVGVLLSFSATFGIGAFSYNLESFLMKPLAFMYKTKVGRFFYKSIKFVVALFSCTFTASLATLPVCVWHFGKVSLVQIISNICVVPLLQMFMLFAFLATAFSFVPFLPWVADAFSVCADLIGDTIHSVVNCFASLPFAYVKADYVFVYVWIGVTALLFLIAYAVRQRGKGLNITCLIISFLVLVGGCGGHILAERNNLNVHIASTNYGQGIVLGGFDGSVTLLFTGENYVSDEIAEILEFSYFGERQMIVSTRGNSAFEDALKLSDLFDYERILMYDTDSDGVYSSSLEVNCENLLFTESDTHINLWSRGKLSILYRQDSVYAYLSYGNKTLLVLPSSGDVNSIDKIYHRADVVIASGVIDNMELLSCNRVYATGNRNLREEVTEYFSEKDIDVFCVEDTEKFNIKG